MQFSAHYSCGQKCTYMVMNVNMEINIMEILGFQLYFLLFFFWGRMVIQQTYSTEKKQEFGTLFFNLFWVFQSKIHKQQT